jgi:hypothetical protein
MGKDDQDSVLVGSRSQFEEEPEFLPPKDGLMRKTKFIS